MSDSKLNTHKLHEAISRFMMDTKHFVSEPFYAFAVQNMQLTFTDKIPTLGVRYKDNKINLVINLEWYNQFPLNLRMDFLKHEVLHVINDHITRCKKITNKDMTKAFNVAADLAINQGLPAIKEFKHEDKDKKFITLDNLKEQYPGLQENKTTEFYYSFFKNDIEQKIKEGNYELTDDHSMWEESELSPEIADMIREELLSKASQQSEDMKRGSTPNDVVIELDKIRKSKNNWKKILQRFVANTQEVLTETTRTKRNRRYGFVQPGHRKFPKHRLAVVIDTSGSCFNEEMFNLFYSEIVGINNAGSEIVVLNCDTEVKSVQEYKPNVKLKFEGGGGTMYQPALDECKKLNVDGIIFFGDMECFDGQLINPKIPVLWAIIGESKRPSDFGWELKVS